MPIGTDWGEDGGLGDVMDGGGIEDTIHVYVEG